MARKRVVSRTITTTIVTAMVTDIQEQKVAYETVTLAGAIHDTAMLDKMTKKAIEKDSRPNIKFNCVIETHEEQSLYSMPEEQFLMMAEKTNKSTEA